MRRAINIEDIPTEIVTKILSDLRNRKDYYFDFLQHAESQDYPNQLESDVSKYEKLHGVKINIYKANVNQAFIELFNDDCKPNVEEIDFDKLKPPENTKPYELFFSSTYEHPNVMNLIFIPKPGKISFFGLMEMVNEKI